MSEKKPKALHCHSDFLFVAQQAYLNNRMPRGLFEACNGNRYLIVQCDLKKYVVVLAHAYHSAFAYCKLKRRPLEYGTWWGRARLRLTHAVDGDAADAPGIILIEGGWVLICCADLQGSLHWCPIGWNAGEAKEGMKFDGWKLEAEDVEYDFFNRLPNGACGGGELCIDIPPESAEFIDIEIDLKADD